MSTRAITWAWEQDVPAGVKLTLLALADFADEEGSCFPGQERLTRMTGASKASIMRHLKQLEELGLLRREARWRGEGRGRTSNRYYLAVNRQRFNVSDCNVEDCDDEPAFKVSNESVQGLILSRSRSHGETPRTIREPSENHQGERDAVARPSETPSLLPELAEPVKQVTPEQSATAEAYEAVNGGFKFMPTRQLAKWAIHERGHGPDEVRDALIGLYRLGKPIIRQTLAQWLDGHIGPQAPRQTAQESALTREWARVLASDPQPSHLLPGSIQ